MNNNNVHTYPHSHTHPHISHPTTTCRERERERQSPKRRPYVTTSVSGQRERSGVPPGGDVKEREREREGWGGGWGGYNSCIPCKCTLHQISVSGIFQAAARPVPINLTKNRVVILGVRGLARPSA